jgi:hypothetical protein
MKDIELNLIIMNEGIKEIEINWYVKQSINGRNNKLLI